MLRVLAFHRIASQSATPQLDPRLVSATPEAFGEQMLHLRRYYTPVSMADIVGAFAEGAPLPPRAVHVTVDDAYRDFRDVVWPVLRELGIPVTVFVPTGYPGRPERAFWWDRLHRAASGRPREECHQAGRIAAEASGVTTTGVHHDPRQALRGLPHDVAEAFIDHFCRELGDLPCGPPEVLDWSELRALRAEGVSFGAHTRDHVALPHVHPERARAEIRGSIDELTRELGETTPVLAYPYGLYDDDVARIAREEGCSLAFTCDPGMNWPGRTDPLKLRRTNITARTTPSLFRIRMLPWLAPVDQWYAQCRR